MPSTHSTQTHKHTKVYICTWLWPEYTFGEWVEMEKRSDLLYHQHSQVQWNFCLHLILSFYFGSPMFIQLGVRIIMWCAGRHSQYSTHIYLYIVIIIIIIISIRQEGIVSNRLHGNSHKIGDRLQIHPLSNRNERLCSSLRFVDISEDQQRLCIISNINWYLCIQVCLHVCVCVSVTSDTTAFCT